MLKSLKRILTKIDSDSPIILQEKILKKNEYSIKNHGIVVDLTNDTKKEWDVIVPGYDSNLLFKTLKLEKVIGILWLSDGKHRIFVQSDKLGFDKNLCLKDIKHYINDFLTNNTDVKGCWIEPISIAK